MTVPFTFGTATTSIPLSNLDSNFNTPITLGNTSIYLGNTTTTIGNLTLTNVTISSGTANITSNITYATANAVVFTNSSSIGTTGANLTFDGTTFTASSIKNSALTSGRVTFAGASGLLTDSANFVFDGTNVGIGTNSPTAKLDITSASAGFSNIKLVQTGVRTWAIENTGTSGLFKIIEASVADRLVIDSSGNVGIGTSSPTALAANYTTVDIRGSTGGALRFGNTTNSAYMYSDSNETNIATATNQRMIFSINTAEKMRLDTSGNLGLGVTPSAWSTVGKSIEIGNEGNAIWGNGNATLHMVSNAYFNSGWKYAGSNLAASYSIQDGLHRWFNAPTGTAGNAITFTQAMTLDANGRLGVGITSPQSQIQVTGSNTYAGAGLLLGSAGSASGYIWTTDNLYIKPNTTAGTTSGVLNIVNFSDVNKFTFDTLANQAIAVGGIFKANGAPSLSAAAAGEAILAPESSLGALLYGRGTTYDVVIGQRSTAVALGVIAATNNIYLGGNIGLGGTTPTTSGTGITFPATQSASSNANTLDDYEEGTWTPVLQFDANTQSIAVNQATYVKIGKAVNINMQITWTAKSGSGRVFITGLPFAKEAGGTVAVLGACLGGSVTTTEALFYNIDAGGTTLNFAQQTGDISSGSLATGGSLMCTGTYFA